MSYEINDKRYNTLKECKARDVFNGDNLYIDKGTEIDSVLAFWILVKASEHVEFEGLTPEECLDKKVELGYIEEV